MKFVSFGAPRCEQPGVLRDEDTIVPLIPLLERAGYTSLDFNAILALLPHLQKDIEAGIEAALDTVDAKSVRLGPPVPRPEKIIVAGGNYQTHIDEANAGEKTPSPSRPLMVLKPSNSVIGPNDALIRPLESKEVDYETEMAVVIGRGGRHIPRDEAYEHVAGYMVGNDVTARDLIAADTGLSPIFAQPTRAKGMPTFAPMGPWLVTPDEVGDPHNLAVRCWVNGELRQNGNTNEMIVDVAGLIADFSKSVTLSPGDVIFTGTTTGCGAWMNPPSFLFGGDVVRMEIEGLGMMETLIVDEA